MNVKVGAISPPRTAERELAQAIEQRGEAERIAAAAKAAAAYVDLRVAWRQAHSRTVELREQGADRIDVDAAVAREAEAALADATVRPERELKRTTAVGDKAAGAVPTTAAEPLLNQVVEWRIRLVGVVAALGVVEDAIDPFAGGEMLAEVRAALARHENLSELALGHLAAAEWRAAPAALLRDAAARTPPP